MYTLFHDFSKGAIHVHVFHEALSSRFQEDKMKKRALNFAKTLR